jgi:hypothetical protein
VAGPNHHLNPVLRNDLVQIRTSNTLLIIMRMMRPHMNYVSISGNSNSIVHSDRNLMIIGRTIVVVLVRTTYFADG